MNMSSFRNGGWNWHEKSYRGDPYRFYDMMAQPGDSLSRDQVGESVMRGSFGELLRTIKRRSLENAILNVFTGNQSSSGVTDMPVLDFFAAPQNPVAGAVGDLLKRSVNALVQKILSGGRNRSYETARSQEALGQFRQSGGQQAAELYRLMNRGRRGL